jgi:hypothetical protein
MATGFGLTLLCNWFVSSPGDVVERLLPLLCAFVVGWRMQGRRLTHPGQDRILPEPEDCR